MLCVCVLYNILSNIKCRNLKKYDIGSSMNTEFELPILISHLSNLFRAYTLLASKYVTYYCAKFKILVYTFNSKFKVFIM